MLLLTTKCWTEKQNFSIVLKCCHFAYFDEEVSVSIWLTIAYYSRFLLCYEWRTPSVAHVWWAIWSDQPSKHTIVQTLNFRVKMCIECTFMSSCDIFVTVTSWTEGKFKEPNIEIRKLKSYCMMSLWPWWVANCFWPLGCCWVTVQPMMTRFLF